MNAINEENEFHEWHIVKSRKDCETFCYVNKLGLMENLGYPESYPSLVKVEYDGVENCYPVYLTKRNLQYLTEKLEKEKQ